MLNNDYTEKLLEIKGIKVNKLLNSEDSLHIHFTLKRKIHKCPCCNHKTDKIHDYRTHIIKDVPILGKQTFLHYRKRRYVCKNCGKKFYEKNNFVAKYYSHTKRLFEYIINKLRSKSSVSDVSKEVNTSVTTAFRAFSLVSYPKPISMPRVLSIDEFRGNAGRKFQCIVTDPKHKKVVDIIKGREEYILSEYFRNMPHRENVEYFIMDMYRPYLNIAKTYFKNATIVIDKFHFVRHIIWAFERVRKDVQKEFSAYRRKYFKHSRTLLTRRRHKLSRSQIQQVNVMLDASRRLANAYMLKEKFLEFVDSESLYEANKKLAAWYWFLCTNPEKEFIQAENTIRNWEEYILNSFKVDYTNGYTEGVNNKIKVLKRIAFGYRNFDNFRNRILHEDAK